MNNNRDYKKEMIALLEAVANDGLKGAIPILIAESVKEANLGNETNDGMLDCVAFHCSKMANKEKPKAKGKDYVCELYAKKTKAVIGTSLGKEIYGWGMTFYKKDEKGLIFVAVDPYHYFRKDKIMVLNGVRVLVHVFK